MQNFALRLNRTLAAFVFAAASVFAALSSATAQLQMNPGFTPVTAGLSGLYVPSGSRFGAAWADFNNDGRLDLIYGGRNGIGVYAVKLYRQEADHSFVEVATNLPALSDPMFSWANVNNDSFPDLLYSGYSDPLDPLSNVTKVYFSNGAGTFNDSGNNIPEMGYRTYADWADYDNDGDLDLLVAGAIADIYRNVNGTLSRANIGLPQRQGSVDWGDYDGDGDLDIIAATESVFDAFLNIYVNDGAGNYSDSGISLPPISGSFAEWGDYDGDGDLDILHNSPGLGSGSVYLNNGGVFTLLDNFSSFIGWTDFDGDGDLDLYGPGAINFNPSPDEPNFNSYNPLPTGITSATMVWADYDGDGDKDYFSSWTDAWGLETATVDLTNFSPAIWGYVADGVNDFAGVTVDGGNLGTTTTDANGFFRFLNVPRNTDYTVTPRFDGYVFTPASESGTLIGVAPLYFAGQIAYRITGTINAGGQPVSGVTVSAGGLGSQTTDASGHYSFPPIADATAYTLTPSKEGYTFSPANVSGNLSQDTVHDFAGDACPSDPAKNLPGLCGCGTSDADSDSDGTPDCQDTCANDSAKTSPGACGCGASDTDSDSDGTADCIDICPANSNYQTADACGPVNCARPDATLRRLPAPRLLVSGRTLTVCMPQVRNARFTVYVEQKGKTLRYPSAAAQKEVRHVPRRNLEVYYRILRGRESTKCSKKAKVRIPQSAQ